MSKEIEGRPWLTMLLDNNWEVRGNCAHCGEPVSESLAMLDDAYNIWRGECPACHAINLLDFSKGRGYTSDRMFLVLPTEEEMRQNRWPEQVPLRPCGCAACAKKAESQEEAANA